MTAATPPGEDLVSLSALLASVGKAMAPALLVQLTADLSAAADSIGRAAPEGDWPTLRRASHNLVALAGTAGVARLQHLAEELNRAAHAEDQSAAVQLAKTILNDIARLGPRILALRTAHRT